MADQEEPYKIEPNNWFSAKPYGFAFYDRSSGVVSAPKRTVWLPISPSNIQVSTPMATNIITTLYGVVEEHSEVRYYDITISGTTGIAPKYIGYPESKTVKNEDDDVAPISRGRTAFDIGEKIPFLSTFIDQISSLAIAKEENIKGTDDKQTGYYAFHKLYQFFLMYKQDTAGSKPDSTESALKRKRHPLTFLNYKDNVQYDCVPLVFNLTRSADNPMLYNYTIQLRAYNLKTIVSNRVTDSFLLSADKLGLFGGTGSSDKSKSDKFADIADLASAVGSFLGGL